MGQSSTPSGCCIRTERVDRVRRENGRRRCIPFAGTPSLFLLAFSGCKSLCCSASQITARESERRCARIRVPQGERGVGYSIPRFDSAVSWRAAARGLENRRRSSRDSGASIACRGSRALMWGCTSPLGSRRCVAILLRSWTGALSRCSLVRYRASNTHVVQQMMRANLEEPSCNNTICGCIPPPASASPQRPTCVKTSGSSSVVAHPACLVSSRHPISSPQITQAPSAPSLTLTIYSCCPA